MNPPAPSSDRSALPTGRPRRGLSAAERIAQAEADFNAGRRNPFASVDLSRFSPEVRAKVDAWQRERGFTPVA